MATPPPPAPRQSITPVVIAFLLAGAAVLGLGWLASNREAGDAGVAPLVLLEPDSGQVVAPRVPLVFETDAPLRLEPEGWQAGRLHLHAIVDGIELMPAAADVEDLGNGRFRWTLPPQPTGLHSVQLFWAGPHHGQLEQGASRLIPFEVR